MHTRALSMIIALMVLAWPGARLCVALNIGDTRDEVDTELGPPRGWIRSDAYELLTYIRGKVELQNGVVTALDIVSQEEAERRGAELQRQMEARRQDAEIRRQNRIEAGTVLKSRMLGDSAFLATSAESQTRFWAEFRQRYPEVPADLEYQGALAQVQREQDALRADLEQRKAEQRLEAAEKRADAAERRAERLARIDTRPLFPFSACPTYCRPIGQPGPRVVSRPSFGGLVVSTSSLLSRDRQGFRALGFTGHSYTRTSLVSSPLLSLTIRK